MSINREAWLTALRAVEPDTNEDASTLAEIAVMFGCQKTAARSRLRKMIAAGMATATNKRIQDTGGRTQMVPAYRLAPAPTVTERPRKRR